jgi:hypothetical protein
MKTVTYLRGLSILALLLSLGGASVATCNLPLTCNQGVSSSDPAMTIVNSGSGGAFLGSSQHQAPPRLTYHLGFGVWRTALESAWKVRVDLA